MGVLKLRVAAVSWILCALGLGLLPAEAPTTGAVGSETCLGKEPTVVGTPGKDRIRLNRRRDRGAVVALLGGRDRVYIQVRFVRVCTGTGNDNILLFDTDGHRFSIDAGPGDDEVDNRMDFELDPSPGPLFADGGAGDDFLQGGEFEDKLLGGPGDDLIGAADARDRLFGGPGRDELYGGPLSDRIFGGPGDDLLRDDPEPAPDYWTLGDDDFADGGDGWDRCVAERERRCEAHYP